MKIGRETGSPTRLMQAARQAGAVDAIRVVACISLACSRGVPVQQALAELRRNQPELFKT